MTRNFSLKAIYIIGAVAALIAALVFRRNLGAEITLFLAQPAPNSTAGWFALLQSNSLLGMGLLNVFDSVNYVLLGVMFTALYFALRKSSIWAAPASALSFVGITVYLASTTAFSMLSLSNQYASAATDTQRLTLLNAGQAILAKGVPGAIYAGIGGYVSLFLIAAAGLLFSVVMLKSRVFHRAIAYIGIAACSLDVAYLAGLVLVSPSQAALLSAACLATAGLLLMIWHLLIALKLYQLSKQEVKIYE
jgi:hypothetical protein